MVAQALRASGALAGKSPKSHATGVAVRQLVQTDRRSQGFGEEDRPANSEGARLADKATNLAKTLGHCFAHGFNRHSPVGWTFGSIGRAVAEKGVDLQQSQRRKPQGPRMQFLADAPQIALVDFEHTPAGLAQALAKVARLLRVVARARRCAFASDRSG